jgi:hypothetical protein
VLRRECAHRSQFMGVAEPHLDGSGQNHNAHFASLDVVPRFCRHENQKAAQAARPYGLTSAQLFGDDALHGSLDFSCPSIGQLLRKRMHLIIARRPTSFTCAKACLVCW